MSNTTAQAIIVAARALVAATATSRSGSEYFLEHTTGQPFEKSPISKRDGFEIVLENQPEITHSFGVTGSKEREFIMLLRVGSAPFDTDKNRETTLAQDMDRLADLLEAQGWWPSGTQRVFAGKGTTDKQNPLWWVSSLPFRVVYVGDILTS